jgi:outer membrane receptor protein involved in Fe transport
MRRTILWAVILAALVSGFSPGAPPARAGTTGKLTGRVTGDKKEALAGVNIRLDGIRLGAASDENGNYVIVGVPAGTYTVRANLVGYAAYIADHVIVTPDFTTELTFQLRTEAVQLGEVRVDATRPLLQKDATGTTRFISSDQIRSLPTRGYRDAATQQAGVVSFQRQIDRESQNGPTLIVRGGRPNETAFYVDGFSQQDPLTGNSTTSINNDAIQEVVVMNGGFNAEYGRIMSGVVNVITKEGGEKFRGGAEMLTDNLGGAPPGAEKYDWNLYDLNFGGPLIPAADWGSFYFSGERRWWGDRAPNGDFSGPLPNNSLGGWTGQAKLTMPLQEKLILKLGAVGSSDDWREYLNTYRYNLAHTPRVKDDNRSVTGQLSHTLSTRAFYTLGASWFFTERRRGDGQYFDDLAAYGPTDADILSDIPWFWPGVSDTLDPLGQVLGRAAMSANGGRGHVFGRYLRRQSSYWALKGEYTHQVNLYHQLKTGAQFDRHTLRFYENYDPMHFPEKTVDILRYGFAADGDALENSGRDGPRHPYTASLYAQDKYERGGLVVNAGLRWDYINTNVPALKSENLPLGADGVLEDVDLVENKTYSRISPRLGVGFPVTEKTVLHANWGFFVQQPNLQDLYASYRFLERVVSRGGYFITFGNPNLKPEQTTAYEFGVAHQINEFAKVDVTAYYKDVKDLVQVANIPSAPFAFASYRNKDFATIKGVDVGVTLRRVNHLSATVNYSLSFAEGTGSVSDTDRNQAWVNSRTPKQTAPLEFDQRHKLSIDFDYALDKGEGPLWGGLRWFGNTDFNVLYNVASGTPYTATQLYDEVTLANVSAIAAGPMNARYGPWTQTVDIKATKSFDLRGYDAAVYVWVLNALDAKNAVQVYTSSGSPNDTGYLHTDEGQAIAENIHTLYGLDGRSVYGQALQNENLFSNPRLIRFGVRVSF